MLYLLKSTGLSNQNVQKIKYVQKVFCRRYRFRNNEKDETIKVRVIGSGSYGDPASLYIRTSEHSKYVNRIRFTFNNEKKRISLS